MEEKISGAFVYHLPMAGSDHCPLLLKLSNSRRENRVEKPFRLQSAWLLYEGFAEFVEKNWDK